MKKLIFTLVILSGIVSSIGTSCKKEKDDENQTPVVVQKIVTLGAQKNTTYNGFYSVGLNQAFSMDQAFLQQDTIDIFCFYEAAGGNNIALAGPGTNITGIFTGASSVENWTVTDTTRFCKVTTLTTAQFDALAETDQTIVSMYDAAVAVRKAKNLVANDIYSFKTQDNKYGLLKVMEVVQDTIGYVKFEVKVKQ